MNSEFTDYVSSEIPTIENENIEYVNDQSNEIPSAKSVNFSYHFLPRKRGFKLAALTVNKLSTHIDELKILLGENPIDVLAINETKLDDSISDNEVYVPGYEIVRRDRTCGGGGGVCFYIRSSTNFLYRSDLNIPNLENLCIEIDKPRSKPFLIITWYRPPESPVEILNRFESLTGKLDAMNVEYYLLGDFNCDQISPISNNDTCLLNNITEINGLTQLIQEATRITEKTSTLLNVIYTNCPNKIVCSGVSHIGISDHSLVFAYRKVSADPSKRGNSTIFYRKLGKFNSADFPSDIAQHDWDSIDQLNNPNDMWAKWKEMFLECIHRHAPLKSKRVRLSKSPWINSNLKKLMHKRDILILKAVHSKNPSDWREFRKHRNFVNSQVRIAKQSYYNNTFKENKGNVRNTWRVINELTSKKVKNSSIKRNQAQR